MLVWYQGCQLRTISVSAISNVDHCAADLGSIGRRFADKRCSESVNLEFIAVVPMCLARHCQVAISRKLLLRARLTGDLAFGASLRRAK